MPLSRHSEVTYLSGNELTRNSSGNTQQQSSRLAEPLCTDPGVNSGMSVRELISTEKKRRQGVYSTMSMFHPVFTPPCPCSTQSLLHHVYVPPWSDILKKKELLASEEKKQHHHHYHVYVPPCLYSTMFMFHRVFTPPCLCSTVSLLHHVYVPPCLCPTMSMFQLVFAPPCL